MPDFAQPYDTQPTIGTTMDSAPISAAEAAQLFDTNMVRLEQSFAEEVYQLCELILGSIFAAVRHGATTATTRRIELATHHNIRHPWADKMRNEVAKNIVTNLVNRGYRVESDAATLAFTVIF